MNAIDIVFALAALGILTAIVVYYEERLRRVTKHRDQLADRVMELTHENHSQRATYGNLDIHLAHAKRDLGLQARKITRLEEQKNHLDSMMTRREQRITNLEAENSDLRAEVQHLSEQKDSVHGPTLRSDEDPTESVDEYHDNVIVPLFEYQTDLDRDH